MAIMKKSIAQLREKAPYILKRKGHAKQKKKLQKAYHGKRLKKWWSSYASWECCKIEELKDAEHVGNRMKGGHTHNHLKNKLLKKHRYLCESKRHKNERYLEDFISRRRYIPAVVHDILNRNSKWRKEDGEI